MKLSILSFLFASTLCIQTGHDQWMLQESGINTHLYGVDFINENLGFAKGEFNVLLKTTDGGENWRDVGTVPGDNWSIHFITDSIGWTCAFYGL